MGFTPFDLAKLNLLKVLKREDLTVGQVVTKDWIYDNMHNPNNYWYVWGDGDKCMGGNGITPMIQILLLE